MLKTEEPINIKSGLKKIFDTVNKVLTDACELALKQPVPRKQLVLKTGASFRCAGYALMIKDNPDHKRQSKRKTNACVAFGSKISSPAQLKMCLYSKQFLAIYMAFLEYAHIVWEATKPTFVLTVKKSVTRFFQTKALLTALWIACDYVLQFNFKRVHIAGSVNTAADFSPDWNSKSRWRCVSKSGMISKQYPLKRPHLRRMLQKIKTSLRNEPSNEKNSLDKKRSNG